MLHFYSFLFVHKNKFFTFFAVALFFIFGILTFNYFDTQKKAKISSDIAVGFAYLGEGKKEISLYYFEKAFNESKGMTNLIAGSGVAKSLVGSFEEDQKILTVLNIMRGSAGKMFQEFINSIYFSRLIKLNSTNLETAEFKKFLQDLSKSKNETIKQIYGVN